MLVTGSNFFWGPGWLQWPLAFPMHFSSPGSLERRGLGFLGVWHLCVRANWFAAQKFDSRVLRMSRMQLLVNTWGAQ